MMMLADRVTIPLEIDDDGVVRVGGTRVTLDAVVEAFDEGATADEIVRQYPSITLADAYATIAFFLSHEQDVRAYLAERERLAEQVRLENERRFDPVGVRERLLSRRK